MAAGKSPKARALVLRPVELDSRRSPRPHCNCGAVPVDATKRGLIWGLVGCAWAISACRTGLEVVSDMDDAATARADGGDGADGSVASDASTSTDSGTLSPADPRLLRSWVIAEPRATPGPLNGAQMAYHPTSERTIIYGGERGRNGERSDEMWAYDGTDWTRICSACPPGPRISASLAYDSVRDRIILFGGITTGTDFSADLWEWDGDRWERQLPDGIPPAPRQSTYVAFDEARARLVVFGGHSIDGMLRDVHEYDGTRWINPSVSGEMPRARSGGRNQALYDPRMEQVVVYGGIDASDTYLDDMWAWDGNGWTELCTACTGRARVASGFAYDVDTGRYLIVGGWDGSDEIAGTLGYLGTTPATVLDGALPLQRDSMGIAYSAHDRTIVIHGGDGASCGGTCADTMVYQILEQ